MYNNRVQRDSKKLNFLEWHMINKIALFKKQVVEHITYYIYVYIYRKGIPIITVQEISTLICA